MTYRFDDFALDLDRHELRLQGRPRPLEPQVFHLLRVLVENHRRLVTRSEIIEAVWQGRIVSDSAVSSRVKSARRALGDDGRRQRYIRTVHGQGFRFLGEPVVEEAPDPGAPVVPATPPTWSEEVLSRPAIAVLPFESVGGDAGDAYFVDGIAEELIAELSSWRWFPVLSRSSSFDRSRAALPAAARATALGARYALTGRFQRVGQAARLAVELIDCATDTQLWSANFPCAVSDLAALEREIALRVFNKIAPELTSAETRRVLRKAPDDLGAWDLTLRGLWHLHRATPNDFSQSLRLLGEATRIDPGFALPWSLIALARFELALKNWTGGPPARIEGTFRGVREAATTAVELDPAGWMGHVLLSVGELWTDASFERARHHADRAIELNPSGSMAYHFSGCIHGFAGALGAAVASQERVYQVDPSYPHADVVEADLGLWRLLDGDLAGAGSHLERALSLNPDNLRARQRQLALAGLSGDHALAQARKQAYPGGGVAIDEAYLQATYPFQDPAHAATFRRGLRLAGIGGI